MPVDLGPSAVSEMWIADPVDVSLPTDVEVISLDGQVPEHDAMVSSFDMAVTRVDAAQNSDSTLLTMTDMETASEDASFGPSKCAERDGVDPCLFGRTTRILESQPFLSVTLEARHRTMETVSALEGEQLLFGFLCDEIFSPDSPEAAFDLLDMDGLRIFRVIHTETDDVYTWLKFYMGDTEVGYIYAESTMTMVAIVSDQDIYRCQVSR